MNTLKIMVLCLASAAFSATAVYWFTQRHEHRSEADRSTDTAPTAPEEKVLYWYDPMVPGQHFDKPGKSPFMDMELVPKYAEDGGDAAGVKIDSGVQQNLAIRRATVERKTLSQAVDVVGSVMFNERDVAVIQTRSNGFVERVYARAPGDVIDAQAPLVDLLIPDWTAAQIEYLALRYNGDAELIGAARQRLKLLGMSSELVSHIEKTGKPQTTITITSPLKGMIQTLEVRAGMSVGMGMTLAKIIGIDTVWLEAAVPETQADQVQVGRSLKARFSAYPDECFHGKVIAVLPETQSETRTLTVRAEFANPDGRLRPGMYAQVRIDAGDLQPQLWVPTETVIRSGKRNVVIVVNSDGSFLPVEVEAGTEAEGNTAILKGLKEGQTVVASGQFLIDSEASLSGVLQRIGGEP